MTSIAPKSGQRQQQQQQLKLGQVGLAAVASSTQTLLLEKLNLRRATPDSEALASSDDEPEAPRQEIQPPTPAQKPVRRASWLNDTSQQPPPPPRKGSFASSSMSPTTSHPSTPAADTGVTAWGAHTLGRGHTGTSPFPWGTGIWNAERKDPPSRLSEVLPSPTSSAPPGGSGSSFFEPSLSQSSAPREQVPNAQIPFAIPLHPTPKTYRSQSYSVGQLDPDTATPPVMGASGFLGARPRPLPHSGLQHRPSRPSMLSEVAHDGSMLGKVNEDDDDDSNESMLGNQQQSAEAKQIEMLTRENALLRQQQYQNRLRTRPSTTSAFGLGNGYVQETVPEETSDYAVDELDEVNDGSDLAKHTAVRRMSEFSAAGVFRSPFSVENRKLENVKKAFWQSTPSYGGIGDLPQSRRHSFADIPTRQGSITSVGDGLGPHDQGPSDFAHAEEYHAPYGEGANLTGGNLSSVNQAYFTGNANLGFPPPQSLAATTHQAYGNQFPSPYAAFGSYANRPSSPHRNMFGIGQLRQNQPLYIVCFKCARADVFYIQEGTGLTVKPGDLVIVEADRGTDLGTVARDNIGWHTAKEAKEHYAEEHYKWLMMYSQNAAAAQESGEMGSRMAPNGLQGSAVGGMGPPSQHHVQESSSGELKPKLIKRLAQNHEVQGLRDKEGNEAKAKRVCMQKVKEHGLNMEILDAEFQMDWKKLTFYYFADSYINFNSLVTDLFKIYKTRIWMSAINPASFVSPTLGLQAPSGVGPGAVGVGRGSGSTTHERRQPPQQPQEPPTPYTPGSGLAGRALAPPQSFAPSFSADRNGGGVAAGSVFGALSNYPYMPPYGVFGSGATRPSNGAPFTPATMAGLDYTLQSTSFAPAGTEFASRARFAAAAGPPVSTAASASLGSRNDWIGSFRDLSLNSR